MNRSLLLILFIISSFSVQSIAQNQIISITGPSCVLAGGSNGVNYSISGTEQGNDNITWQVSGGVIVGKGIAMASGAFSALGRDIRVIWNQVSKSGTVKVTSKSSGVAMLQVSVITILNKIDSTVHAVSKNSSLNINGDGPDIICNTSYTYWWEFSDSLMGPFVQIDGSNSRNLIRDSLKTSGFYRRVLSVNGDNIYSNVIYVQVKDSKTSFNKIWGSDPWAIIRMRDLRLRNTLLYKYEHA
jgi:hypothetical protein